MSNGSNDSRHSVHRHLALFFFDKPSSPFPDHQKGKTEGPLMDDTLTQSLSLTRCFQRDSAPKASRPTKGPVYL